MNNKFHAKYVINLFFLINMSIIHNYVKENLNFHNNLNSKTNITLLQIIQIMFKQIIKLSNIHTFKILIKI